jgi:DNA mismatch repair ATPase MutS
LFELITHTEFRTPLLRRLQASLTVEGLAAHQQMRRLGRLASLSIPRSSQLYILIQLFTLWDIHALWLLERWQDSVGRHARGWLETLGEVEALAALATLAHDNPDWAFPEVDESADRLEAEALGHPIIPDSVRVTNDVTVGPSGTFLLVTGSNMSGKSTLLRALGVNLVLAGTGGPVCAASMRCPPVTLWTAMRVQDSLARGVSYFMAELERLKAVVDAARAARAEGTRTFFYLLDEILQGTNTAERQIAARRIILHLVAQGALGAVSTHDLTLADAPDVAAAARLVHFTETITADDAPRMTFDYKLRPGLATSTNALKLMEIVGLDLDGA